MLAERTVRRLSIRAPADALARRAGFLIEDALRTASLPGDGAELLLLRRLRLPPFTAAASPQQVALRLEAVCRAAIAIDGSRVDDAALGSAPALRFADALTAHLALTRLILGGVARQAWCWPLLVKGYRPTLGNGAALRLLALSLADLPEAPAALPYWFALLVGHGQAGCVALLLALQGDDVARLQSACRVARLPAALTAPTRWQALLDWSAARLGGEDVRHHWLLGMARACGVDVDRSVRRESGTTGDQGTEEARALTLVVRRPDDDGRDRQRREAAGCDAAHAVTARGKGGPPAAAAGAPAPRPTRAFAEADETVPAARQFAAPAQAEAAASGDDPSARPGDPPGPGKAVGSARPSLLQPPEAVALAVSDGPAVPPSVVADEVPATVDRGAAAVAIDAATAAGGLLFLVPLLTRLGLAAFLEEDAAPSDLPQRIFATLLRRLPIADEDPVWLLCGRLLAVDGEVAGEADREAARWLGRCRRHLRRHVGIGLYSLVCRPARVAITATHVDVCQAIDAVDLRLRRAGLDIDPGWVPWLGRVLRFHYGRDR